MKRTMPNHRKPIQRILVNVIFVLGSLLTVVGCSVPLNRWRLPSYRPDYTGMDRLCAHRGKRVAIVPGREFDSVVKSNEHRFGSGRRNYGTASADGTLRVTIDDGSPFVVDGGSTLPPEVISYAVRMLHEMGFFVVDRQHVARVLEEQDIQAVYARDVRRIGELLGADILVVLSTLQTPVAYFSAGGYGDWALGCDMRFRTNESWISVPDGTYLATFSESGSTLGFCGFTHLEARQRTGLVATETELRLRANDGSYVLITDVDTSSCAKEAMDAYWTRAMREWEAVCGRASSERR